ncbi:hypothetical protein QTH87_03495 [Variovorax sp. J22P168]|uniref:hypothetical protein n=1 Tax=Variovorax jilinensis TaxID=3053513 RepID=UPI002577561C|nr:hypothetical protein [Variovorax sp. J22P168]MDM0011496.1 hypothetical protein [Variovorax sp. J22P168]
MAIDEPVLTPQQRLARSRRALVDQLQGGRPRRDDEFDAYPPDEGETQATGDGADEPRGAHPFAWTSIARGVARRWWRRHPANAVGQLARPLLDRYARDEPAKLVAAAAATGALVVLIKPWRLLSITAVLAALLKSSDVADMVTTLMEKNAHPPKDVS